MNISDRLIFCVSSNVPNTKYNVTYTVNSLLVEKKIQTYILIFLCPFTGSLNKFKSYVNASVFIYCNHAYMQYPAF